MYATISIVGRCLRRSRRIETRHLLLEAVNDGHGVWFRWWSRVIEPLQSASQMARDGAGSGGIASAARLIWSGGGEIVAQSGVVIGNENEVGLVALCSCFGHLIISCWVLFKVH